MSCIYIPRTYAELDEIGNYLSVIRDCYPGFHKWFAQKVLPNVSSGERLVFGVKKHGNLNGAMILKKTPSEIKLCTLYIGETARHEHIGSDLVRIASEELQTYKIPVTVSETNIEWFIDNPSFNFYIVGTRHDLYKTGVTEYTGFCMYRDADYRLTSKNG